MTRSLPYFVLFLALVWAAPAAPDSPQSSQQSKPPRFAVEVGAVALDVVVTDKNGRFVRGLKRNDFLVLEEGAQQDLTFFTADITPVTVLVLLDSSSSVRANLRALQKDANRFISKLHRGDRARVGFFHDSVVFGPRFTDNLNEHIAMINNMRPQRGTHLYDALLDSLRELAAIPDRKALLLFTDGDDAGSDASMEEALEAARQSFASIYAVGLLGWSAEEGMNINQDLLTELAKYTGGRPFFPKDEKEMGKAFDRIREELHLQYRMAYMPGNNVGRRVWRNVEVRMAKRKNLVVRTRLGYYSRPEDAPSSRATGTIGRSL